MDKKQQIKRAEDFLILHHDPRLLVLPNIWDPLGARLLEGMGFPAVATASAAVAFSLGYDDGEKIRFDAMLDVIGRIAASVNVPLSADIERGYAESPDAVAKNVQRVLRAGAVGINLEDSTVEGGPLLRVDFQCARIRAVRAMAQREGVPLVINARIDTFMGGVQGSHADKVAETIARAQAYFEAGADCVYPITVGDIETLKMIREETRAPINVYAAEGTASMRELEAARINRLSLGPGFLKTGLTAMKNVAADLLEYGSYQRFTRGTMTSDEVRKYVSDEEMP
ncbi:MAG: isocitrate lyase/phosphoenolpyruvate mutase family protein [Candidatus Krumholzibacteriia bacterium]